jgi:hypothetical protein
MTSQGGLEKRALVREILIEGSHGDAGAMGDAGGGQPLLADTEQNLNGGFENGIDAGGRSRLNGRFTGLQEGWGRGGQMRTPNLKLSSSNHMDADWRQKGLAEKGDGK